MSGRRDGRRLPAGVPLRVVKLGGSLLDWPPLVTQLRRWLSEQPPAVNLLVAGGGTLADAVRQADALHRIGEESAHWLCIRAMGVTARTVAALLPESQLIEELPITPPEGQAPLCVFDTLPWLTTDEPVLAGTRLEHGWHVTSDSIAARLAVVTGAEELVLLKSALPSVDVTPGDAAQQDYVDQFFPRLLAELARVRCVNLRDPRHAERVWK